MLIGLCPRKDIKMDWISVHERLPQQTERVLVSCSKFVPSIMIAMFTLENEFMCEATWEGDIIYPEAWMPLPKKYKKGKHEAKYARTKFEF